MAHESKVSVLIVSVAPQCPTPIMLGAPFSANVGELRRLLWRCIVNGNTFPSIRRQLERDGRLNDDRFAALLILTNDGVILTDGMSVRPVNNATVSVALGENFVNVKLSPAGADDSASIVPLHNACETVAEFTTRLLMTPFIVDAVPFDVLSVRIVDAERRPLEAQARISNYNKGVVWIVADLPSATNCSTQREALAELDGCTLVSPIHDSNSDVAAIQKQALYLAGKSSLTPTDRSTFTSLLRQFPDLVNNRQLLSAATVDSVDVPSATSLLYTAARGANVDAVEVLCECGANPGLKVSNPSQSTPMHVACYRGYEHIVQLMLHNSQFPYDVETRNAYGELCTDKFSDDVPHSYRNSIQHVVKHPEQLDHPNNSKALVQSTPPKLWFAQPKLGDPILLNPRKQHLLTLAFENGKVAADDRFDGVRYDLRGVEWNRDLQVEENATRDLRRITCDWFFVGNDAQLEPLPLPERLAVQQATRGGAITLRTDSHVDAELGVHSRHYNLQELFSANCVSGRIRPLLRISEHNVATIGSCNAQWALRLSHYGSDACLPLSAATDLNQAFHGLPITSIKTSTDPGGLKRHARTDLEVFLSDPVPDGDNLSFKAQFWPGQNSRPIQATAIRYSPMAFFLAAGATGTALRSFPPQTTCALMRALAAGHTVLRDEGWEFNLLRREMRDLRAPPGECFPVPIVLARPNDLGLVIDPLAFGVCFDTDPDKTSGDLLAAMRCMQVLLAQGCALVGGAVADVLVHRELLQTGFHGERYAIEAELPQTVNAQNYKNWVCVLVEKLLSSQLGLTAREEDLRLEPTEDPLTGVVTPNGRLCVDVGQRLTLLLVPAWNTSMHPKRTLDFSFGNLRLEPVGVQSEPRYRLLQSVPIGLPTAVLIEATRARRAAPVMGVDWRNGVPMPRRLLSFSRRLVLAEQLTLVRSTYALVTLDGMVPTIES